MKEIDEQINSLEDKFKKFENRVQDIQARNKEFEDKTGVPDDKSRFKQII
jgi:predicted nuclease with TOPRIM domain